MREILPRAVVLGIVETRRRMSAWWRFLYVDEDLDVLLILPWQEWERSEEKRVSLLLVACAH